MGSGNVYENTVSLWGDKSDARVTLRNTRTGEIFRFILSQSFVVGRNGELCDLQITKNDQFISGEHLRFIRAQGAIFVEDMQSKNGTWLNKKRLLSRARIRSGDTLRMGKSDFECTYK